MAFKMKGFNPGKGTGMGSAFTKKNDKNLKYRDPAEFSGPGEYIKHTGKWMGGKLKKSMGDLVGGVASLGGMLGKKMKKGKEGSAMKKTQDDDWQNNMTGLGHPGPPSQRAIDAFEKKHGGAIRNKRRMEEYDKKNWRYDDTIRDYNRDGTHKYLSDLDYDNLVRNEKGRMTLKRKNKK
tara:strand:- start:649 stop:1185 length:537 start_codon:yes stop_codon:yes gene_type:complete